MLLTSQFSAKHYIQYLLLLAVLVAFSVIIFYNTFNAVYWPVMGLVIGAGCWVIILFIVRYLVRLPIYTFYDSYVEITDALHNHQATIAYSAIAYQKVEYYRSWNESYSRIVLVTNSTAHYRIASYHYRNYEDITAFLYDKVTQHQPEKDITKAVDAKWWTIIGLLLGVLAVWLLSSQYSRTQTPDADLAIVRGTISHSPLVKKSGKYNYELPLRLNEYPGFTFLIENEAYSVIDLKGITQKVNVGDSLQLTIAKRERDVKLTKTVTPGFSDLHYRYYTISVMAISSNKQVFLSLEAYRNSYKKLFTLTNMLCVVCLAFFVHALYRVYLRVSKGHW